MALFYLENINGKVLDLPEEESRHILKVLRMRGDDPLELTDGKGLFCRAKISETGKKIVRVEIIERQQLTSPRNYKLHMAVAPVKNLDRFEWFLEKATEIGIDEISPVITQNSERTSLRPDRLEKILIAAMKQSLKVHKPVLNPTITLEKFLRIKRPDYQLFIAYCGENNRRLLKNSYQKGRNSVILIGPEGDFTEEEVSLAKAMDYQVVSLGDSRLRTETAAVVACHSFEILNQSE
ncbi:MAG: 16S rRNA (uracil(1498)-N(3))-methyltransferase [Bacteroidales bacterium]|nr:16S rRNA (uracil(1498)-N(3))-methyltransferase [Bacteroidales bacterium]